MIDFRYHLISIVAVFLALGIGILMGSVVLDQRLVDNLRSELNGVRETNEELRGLTVELRRQVDADENFALAARDLLLDGALDDAPVVLITYAGTDGEVLDAVRAGIEGAGGRIETTLRATEKLALQGQPERDELALLVGSVSGATEELLAEAGRVLGERIGAVVAEEPADQDETGTPPPPTGVQVRLEEVVEGLETAGYVDVDRRRGDVTAAPGDAVVIVGGSSEEPPFPIAEFSVNLVTSIAGDEVGVLVAEASESGWGLATIMRVDDEAQESVSTVDQAESTSGTIAVVLGLAQAKGGCTGHYGVSGGASGIIPRPSDVC